MRLNRKLCGRIALLFALLLPLQGLVALPACAAHAAAGSTAHGHCAPELAPTHHHACGSCCCAAASALPPAQWIPPYRTAAVISAAVVHSPPAVALDRLDRPPRFILL
jgi:hypothetical protein